MVAATLAVLVVTVLSATASPPSSLIATTVTAQGGFGTIKGRLVWGGDQAPKRKIKFEKGKADPNLKDPQVCAKNESIPADDLVVDPKTKGVQYAFAYLVAPKGKNDEAMKALVAKQPKVELDQSNCRFVPHCVAALADQSVVFKSSDPINHNIRLSALKNEAFNQMLPPNGELEKKLVFEARPLPLACDIHPWMQGYLMVFNHPFFAVTGEDGSFEITGVPAGTQNLNLWQEKVGYVTGSNRGTPVDVKAGGTVDVGEIKLDPAKVRP